MSQTKTFKSKGAPEDWRRAAAERLRGLFADTAPGRSLVDELIAERRTEARAEDFDGRVGVTIAGVTFNRAEYDADADVLYLHVGDPSRAVDYDETPEGHAVRYDGNGALVGLTLVRPKRLLEQEGELPITVPVPSAVPAAELAPVLSAHHRR